MLQFDVDRQGAVPPRLREVGIGLDVVTATRSMPGAVSSRCDAHVVVKKLGRKISAVRPRHRLEVGVNLKRTKHRRISKGLEDGAVQFRRQIDLALGTVSKSEPQG